MGHTQGDSKKDATPQPKKSYPRRNIVEKDLDNVTRLKDFKK